jgi:hypothetical protein
MSAAFYDCQPIIAANLANVAAWRGDQAITNLANFTVSATDFFDVRATNTLNVISNCVVQSGGELNLRSGGTIEISNSAITINNGSSVNMITGGAALPKRRMQHERKYQPFQAISSFIPEKFDCGIFPANIGCLVRIDIPISCHIKLKLHDFRGRLLYYADLGEIQKGRHFHRIYRAVSSYGIAMLVIEADAMRIAKKSPFLHYWKRN